MAATIKQLESAIETKLKTALPEFEVAPFPEKPEEYQLLHPFGAVLIQYEGSTYGNNKIVAGAVAQVRYVRFSATVLIRNLRSSSGCYEVMQRINTALHGLTIAGTISAVSMVSEQFYAEADGVWCYVQTYAVATKVVSAVHG